MVKNRNWQQRVEKAEARKEEAKLKKLKSGERKVSKGYFSELIALLDRHDEVLRSPQVTFKDGTAIHVWTEKIPSDSLSLLEQVLQQQEEKKKQRPRSASMESEGSNSRKGGRGRSDSMSGKKKVHPRSKEATGDSLDAPTDGGDALTLCRAHFFEDACASQGNKKKTAACKHEHYSAPFRTLGQVMEGATTALAETQQAVVRSIPQEQELLNPGGMDMLYHFPVPLAKLDGHKKNDNATAEVGTCLSMELASNGIVASSVVYVAFNGTLVYDRYRRGVLLSDLEFLEHAVGTGIPRRHRFSIGSENDDTDSSHNLYHGEIVLLNGTILEHILTFLPDAAVPVLSSVCRDWHREIGQSPHLWRHLLERRQWPKPTATKNSRDAYRDEFVQHYSVRRDAIGLKSAIQAIHHRLKVPQVEFTYQDFTARKNTPSYPNVCAAIKVWSKNRILAAYSQDCSLRLFETTVPDGREKRCRELVCQRVDPYRSTKKRNCELITVELDEESIGCLCHVVADGTDMEAYVLVTMSRHQFMLGESSDLSTEGLDEAGWNMVNLGESILNYLICMDDRMDHGIQHLVEFLCSGGEMSDVEVLVSHSLASCGYGMFLIEASISIPLEVIGTDGNTERTMQQIDRRLFVFSVNHSAIVWDGNGYPVDGILRGDDLTFTGLHKKCSGDGHHVSYLGMATSGSPAVYISEIHSSGEVLPHLLKSSFLSRSAMHPEVSQENVDTWELSSDKQRLVVLTSHHVVLGDCWHIYDNREVRKRKSVLTFLTQDPHDESFDFIELGENVEVLRMVVLREDYVLVLYRKHPEEENPALNTEYSSSLFIVAYHVPTRTEIFHSKVFEGFEEDFEGIPLITNANEETIGLGHLWKGVAMTGQDVQCTGNRKEVVSPKKKKGRHVKGKKDGFARGLRLHR